MTTTITAEMGRAAHTLHLQVKELAHEIEAKFYALGFVLTRIRDGRLYEALGADSFDAYIADPEIGIPVTTAYRVMRVYALTTANHGSPPLLGSDRLLSIGIAKADMIRPALEKAATDDERERIADQAAALSVSDLRRQLASERGADVDAAWRVDSEFFIRQARQTIRRIEDADDLPAALARWDDLCATAMRARERLQGRS